MKCQSRGQISREIHRCCCLVIFSPQTSLKMRRVKASIYLPCSKHYTLLAFLNFHKFPNLILIKIKVLCLRLKKLLSLISNHLVLFIELQTYGIFLIIFQETKFIRLININHHLDVTHVIFLQTICSWISERPISSLNYNLRCLWSAFLCQNSVRNERK